MNIVHYGHSCLAIELNGARLLFDPGTYSEGFEKEQELDAVFVTHQHPDHLDLERLPTLLAANPGARLITDPGSAESVRKLGLPVEVATPGDTFDIAGTLVSAVGGQHEIVHADIPAIPNTGYVLDRGTFYHPGDSYFVPPHPIDVLGLPTGAPWLKVGEAIDFLRAVSPKVAIPIHEATLANPAGHYALFTKLGPESTEVRVLVPGEKTTLAN